MTRPFRSLPLALMAATGAASLLAGCQTVAPPIAAHGLTQRQIAVLKNEGFVETPRGWALSMDDRLLFPTNDSTITASKATRITQMATALRGVGVERARVEGYTDSIGAEQYNDQLSVRRAQAVADVMAQCGFAPANLVVRGLGESRPIESNRTVAGRAQNRRVVILVSAIG